MVTAEHNIECDFEGLRYIIECSGVPRDQHGKLLPDAPFIRVLIPTSQLNYLNENNSQAMKSKPRFLEQIEKIAKQFGVYPSHVGYSHCRGEYCEILDLIRIPWWLPQQSPSGLSLPEAIRTQLGSPIRELPEVV